MRSRFDEQLSQLNNSLIEMGALIEDAISKTVKALRERDAEAAKKIKRGDDVIDDKEKEIESLCLKLLLNQQPVARDLRMISTALKMITDMERIGDHAADIASLCIELPAYNRIGHVDTISLMGPETIRMVTDSIDAYVRKDLDLAHEVINRDQEVNRLFRAVKRELILLVHKNADDGEEAFDLMQIAKYFERIGDHAVNLAEWVIFSITGVHKDTRILLKRFTLWRTTTASWSWSAMRWAPPDSRPGASRSRSRSGRPWTSRRTSFCWISCCRARTACAS